MDVQEESEEDRKFGEELSEQSMESCPQLEESQLFISSPLTGGKPPPVVKCVIHSSLLLEKQAAV